jgi:2-(1,2-epoxy-1,2-dihydrophenyl)acetyl-CoA isomerase
MEHIAITINEKGVALLELNRPQVLNALNQALLREMIEALQELGANPEVKVLIVTGRGKGFCAGADLTAVTEPPGAGIDMGKQVSDSMAATFNPMMELLYTFPRPVVSAINGIAAGGGAGIALCADIVLAANSSALKVVQVPQLGIAADLGANWLLSRIVGRSRALGACLTGITIVPEQLMAWGLAWECVDDQLLLARAQEIATQLARVPASTVIATRSLVDRAPASSFEASIEEERQHQEKLCNAPVFIDSVARFLQR